MRCRTARGQATPLDYNAPAGIVLENSPDYEAIRKAPLSLWETG